MGEVERIFKQSEEQEPVIKIEMQVGDKIMVLSEARMSLTARLNSGSDCM
jgi:hypothetical protein